VRCMRQVGDAVQPALGRWPRQRGASILALGGGAMPKDASAKVATDPLALRLAALGALMDHVIATLRRSGERIRDLRVGIALARESATSTEPTTAVRRRDLDNLRE
jgi:hypothetical protein